MESTSEESIPYSLATYNNNYTMEAISPIPTIKKWCPILAPTFHKSTMDNGLSDRYDEIKDSDFPLFDEFELIKNKENNKENNKNGLKISLQIHSIQNYPTNSSPSKIEKLSLLSKFSKKFTKSDSPAIYRWRKLISQIYQLQCYNPWPEFNENISAEKARRHRYSAIQKRWIEDDVFVKIESLPFDHGAMRECYKMRKLSGRYPQSQSRVHTSNYVAKRYIDENTNRQVYFDDVRLQMEAKLWAEEFNRYDPPKKIDVFQLSVLEFVDRPNAPLYHIERYMEGEYRKYNSNSGFVDEICRNTPQAFSHFTFENSGHRLMIIDIQGVGDLYTDPQIHTSDSQGYGDGNLGVRGMALFFHSHRCNSVCQYLGLDRFELSENELNAFDQTLFNNQNDKEDEKSDVNNKINEKDRCRIRSISVGESGTQARNPRGSSFSGISTMSLAGDSGVIVQQLSRSSRRYGRSRTQSVAITDDSNESGFFGEDDCQENEESSSWMDYKPAMPSGRNRGISECSDVDFMPEEDAHQFHLLIHDNHRKSTNVHSTCNLDQEDGHSILAKIHYETAYLHANGRFVNLNPAQQTPSMNMHVDWESTIHHLRLAAQLGCPDSMWELACFSSNYHHLFSQHNASILSLCPLKPSQVDCDNSTEYLWRAANVNHIQSMHMYAKLCEQGSVNDDVMNSPNISEAICWYDKVLQEMLLLGSDDQSVVDIIGLTVYELCAHMASLIASDDPQRAGDLYTQAAELATAAMKGRLANKYFEMAEEKYSRC